MNEKRLPLLATVRAVLSRRAAQAVFASPLRDRLAKRRPARHDGRAVEPTTAAMLALDDVIGGTDLSNLGVRAARLKYEEQCFLADGDPPAGVTAEDRAFRGPAGWLRARIYVPDAVSTRISSAVVFFHGGGWVTCSVETHDVLCRRLALEAGCRVVSIDYRLAPEARFPAAVDDAVAGTRWVLANARSLSIDPSRVAVAGDSAGGNLAAVVARKLATEPVKPCLQILIYPATDATFAMPSHESLAKGWLLTRKNIDWYFEKYAGGHDPLDPDLSPLHAKSLAGCPPAVVVTAGLDPLRDEGRAYADKLRSHGTRVTYVEHEGLVHGFALMTAIVPAARQAVLDLARLVQRELESPRESADRPADAAPRA